MKPNIALPAFHITETTRFSVEADHALTLQLRRYQEFYKQAYGATVSEGDLLREMARRFMASDPDFQGFGQKRRRSRRNQAAPSDAEANYNGKLPLGGPEK